MEKSKTTQKPDVLKIERGIEMPNLAAMRRKFPFDEMAVGDSFLVPAVDRAQLLVARTALSQAATQYKHRHPGWNYSTRAQPNGVRIWRTE